MDAESVLDDRDILIGARFSLFGPAEWRSCKRTLTGYLLDDSVGVVSVTLAFKVSDEIDQLLEVTTTRKRCGFDQTYPATAEPATVTIHEQQRDATLWATTDSTLIATDFLDVEVLISAYRWPVEQLRLVLVNPDKFLGHPISTPWQRRRR